jgi:hypothetical protein
MPMENPPSMPEPETLWKISGGITPARIGPLYKIGAIFNAVAMLLLPGLYFGVIGGLGWLIYSRATQPSRPNHDDDVWNVLLIVIGAILLIFLVKPLFARRPKTTPPLKITREQQPRLFAFIDEICALVRAPRPRHVQLDMNVNASAGFSRSFGSLLRRDLTLTIGLPLVSGLTVRGFGGVLAHEFGHFAQGAGMRMTYVIRATNAWFARLVYERDSLNEFLREASRRIDIRIGILFYTARLMVWLTRKVLWVIMWIGNVLSCFMLRQMEFDADHYETQLAGSEAFARTAESLRLLGVGWQRAVGIQQESFSAGRLVNDLPGFVALETRRLPVEVGHAIGKALAESKTGWFDTHPCDADRVRAAEKAGTSGVLSGEGPATEMFDDFSSLTQQATAAYYQHECAIDLKGVQLLPLDAVASEVSAQVEMEKATKEFFDGLLTVRTMVIFSPGELYQTPPREALTAEWRAACEKQSAVATGRQQCINEMLEGDRVDQSMAQAKVLLQAGFKLNKGSFELAEPTIANVGNAEEAARRKIAHWREKLEPDLGAARARFVAALRVYFLEPLPAGLSPATREEVEGLTRIISRLEPLLGTILSLRNHVAAFAILLRNMPEEGNNTFYQTARKLGATIIAETDRILQATAGLNYPFDHGRGTVLLCDYLVESASHPDESVHAYLRGEALVDRLLTLYYRIMGHLAQSALEAERTVLSASAGATAQQAAFLDSENRDSLRMA